MSKSIIAALLAVIVIGAGAWYFIGRYEDSDTLPIIQSSPAPATADPVSELQPVAIEPTLASAPVDAALAALEGAGMSVVSDGELIYQYVKANGGARVVADGTYVEVYSYADASTQQEGVAMLQGLIDAVEDGTDAAADQEELAATIYQKAGLVVVVRGTDTAKNEAIARAASVN